MRSVERNGVTLIYPDAIGFAFNPCLIVARGDGIESMSVEMTSENGTVVNDERNAFSGGCYAEVREYIQGFFDSDVMSQVDYTVAQERMRTGQRVQFVVVAGGETFDFSVFYVWGAMKSGAREVYNRPRELVAFVGYPFTAGVYVGQQGELEVRNVGMDEEAVIKTISGEGVWNIPIEPSSVDDYFFIGDVDGGIMQATFDDTFDLTFQLEAYGAENYVRVKVGEDIKGGVYLRWINRHGFFSYWLFKKNTESEKVKNEGQFVRNNIVTADMEYGYAGGLGRQMIMTREEGVAIGASLVDSDTWDMLSDMVSSPILDMFTGYVNGEPRWVSVQATAGTLTKTGAVLQDFVANIELPEVQIQRL